MCVSERERAITSKRGRKSSRGRERKREIVKERKGGKKEREREGRQRERERESDNVIEKPKELSKEGRER